MSQISSVTTASELGAVLTLTGNSGGAVAPDGSGNINVVGSGSITVTDNPGTHTLTISGSTDASSFVTNSGTAVPVAGVLNVVGGTGITTSGSGDTVTISVTGSTYLNYTGVSTSPYVVASTDDFLGVDTTGMAIQINLPNAPATGRVYTIKDIFGNAATNNITVTTVGGVVDVDGATTFVMNTAYESIQVLFNGTAYLVF